ncbi:hypothetical protein ANO14919_074020 [Xylariales sp. No.14919]|nr:hypothetical protein ANO14919_074020 [Xylariales sp. No.14919]
MTLISYLTVWIDHGEANTGIEHGAVTIGSRYERFQKLKDENPLSMFQDLLLRYAVQGEHVQLAEAILGLEKGFRQTMPWGPDKSDLDYDVAKRRSPAIATEAGHLDTVEFLLRHNANDPEGFHRGHLGIKRTITKLAPYADPAVAASQPKFVSPDYHAVLERLIQAGGDTLKENTEAREALAQGIDLGVDFSVIKILLDADVDPLIPAWHRLDWFQLAPLNGSEKVCWHLWDHGRAHPRPSHWLQHSECTISSIKQVFVQALALATAIDIPNDRGRTLLFSTGLKGNQVLVETLLAHGANVKAADYAGRTPLWAAVYGGNPGAVNASLKVGPNVIGSVMSLRLEKHCEDSGTGVEARSTWLLSDTPIRKPGASLCRDRTSVT